MEFELIIEFCIFFSFAALVVLANFAIVKCRQSGKNSVGIVSVQEWMQVLVVE